MNTLIDKWPTDAGLVKPPHLLRNGQKRQIGVEVEFSGLGCRQAADLVHRRFGGQVVEINAYQYTVSDSRLGNFTVELDFHYAHRRLAEEQKRQKPGEEGATKEHEGQSPEQGQRLGELLEASLSETAGDIGSLWMPVEIVTPPVCLAQLTELDGIIDDLRRAGAEGTDEGMLFAFGTQLNPDAPSLETDCLLRHFQAFLLLSDTLRNEIELDVKRRLLPFVDPFPSSYIRRVVDPGYRPDIGEFIDEYIEANPTRNRDLDMLPLLCHLDPERVRARIKDERIKSRPTFHYRLPDTRLSDPDWGLITEWNRWVRGEQLADDKAQLSAVAESYLKRSAGWLPAEWIDAVRRLLQ